MVELCRYLFSFFLKMAKIWVGQMMLNGGKKGDGHSYHMIDRSDISRKKIKISRDFQGQIRRKIGRFRGISAEKIQISKDFQGQILRKIGQFHGKFRGKLRQEQSVKNSRFCWIFFGKFR